MKNTKKFRIDNQIFPSRSAAARYLDISDAMITTIIKKYGGIFRGHFVSYAKSETLPIEEVLIENRELKTLVSKMKNHANCALQYEDDCKIKQCPCNLWRLSE